ncbi:MAG: PilZ domain-containing protein [Desulfosudaceae bacterium]
MNDNLPRTYMTKDDKAAFTCPKCNKSRLMDVSRFKSVNKASIKVKVKCPCGHQYSIILERRKEIRKEVAFIGTYTAIEKGVDVVGRITVKDLSRSGLRFKTHLPRQFEVDEELLLEFELDDREQSQVQRKVIVRSQHGDSVGVSFVTSNHYDKLGAYLLYSL